MAKVGYGMGVREIDYDPDTTYQDRYAYVTVNTPNGSITIQCQKLVPISEKGTAEFLRYCLDKQNEFAEIVKKLQ